MHLPCGTVQSIDTAIADVAIWPDVKKFSTSLKVGDEIHPITSSLNRYGQFILQADNRVKVDELIGKYEKCINNMIKIQQK